MVSLVDFEKWIDDNFEITEIGGKVHVIGRESDRRIPIYCIPLDCLQGVFGDVIERYDDSRDIELEALLKRSKEHKSQFDPIVENWKDSGFIQ